MAKDFTGNNKFNDSNKENLATSAPLLFRKIEKGLLYLANICVFGILFITSFDVIGRYFFNKALGWAYDTSLVFMVGLCFLSLSDVQAGKGNVSVMLFTYRMPRFVKNWLPLLHNSIGFFVYALIGVMGLKYAIEAAKLGWVYGLQAPIPVWIPYSCIAIGSFSLSVRLIIENILLILNQSCQRNTL